MLKRMRNVSKCRKGQSLVEYGILIGGVALICLAAVAILGHKSNDLIASVAAALPCAHDDDIGPIVSGKLVNTTQDTNGVVYLDASTPGSIEGNVGIPGIGALVVEAATSPRSRLAALSPDGNSPQIRPSPAGGRADSLAPGGTVRFRQKRRPWRRLAAL